MVYNIIKANDISFDSVLIKKIIDEMRGLAERIEKKGIIRVCEKGEELSEDQKYRFYDNRFVEEVLWSVTEFCNYRCRHCFMDAPDGTLIK